MYYKNIYAIIDSLDISRGWKNVFKKIQTAYFHNFYQGKANNVHMWRYGQPVISYGASDRFKFFTRFNFFALIFGPLYYLAKFMFLKGLFLLLIEAALIYYYGFPVAYFAIFIHIYAAIFANSDYFIQKVLNHKEVKENPGYLSDYIDENFVKNVLKEQSYYVPFAIFCLLFGIGAVLFIGNEFAVDAKYQEIVNNKQKVCSDNDSCIRLINTSVSNIKAGKEPVDAEYFNAGAAYYQLGNKQNALNALNQATLKNPNHFASYILKGIIYTELGQYNYARASYEKALQIYPKGKFLYYLLGSAYYKEGKYTEAKTNFEKAVKAYPKKAAYREALAYTKIYLKDTKGAKADLERAIKILKNEKGASGNTRIEALERYAGSLK